MRSISQGAPISKRFQVLDWDGYITVRRGVSSHLDQSPSDVDSPVPSRSEVK